MELNSIKAVYFIGAGGIGMSALARYFVKKGLVVAGYDRTPSELTKQLEKEGVLMHYTEDVSEIPHACKNAQSTLVIYTPAIPNTHAVKCEGFARVDFMVVGDKPYFMEVNTLPGMTAASLLPKSTASKGYSYTETLDLLIEASRNIKR